MKQERVQQEIRTALRLIEGQVRGLQRMVDDHRPCLETLQQVAAARAALQSVGTKILVEHLHHCVGEAVESDNPRQALRDVGDLIRRLYA